MDKVFKIEDLRPIRDEMTISRNSRLSDKTPITYFSLGKGTSISQESYDNTTVYIGAKGCADFLIGDYAAKHTISEGDMLVVPSKTLCGVTTETGCIYTEIIIKKENNNMNKIIKSGEVMKLKDLISYEDGSITNIDVVSNDTMKFVLMAFDEGTGLTPHRAPGNAIIFALEGKAVIDYEGKDYTISAGENFRFDKNGLHSVTADERFKMDFFWCWSKACFTLFSNPMPPLPKHRHCVYLHQKRYHHDKPYYRLCHYHSCIAKQWHKCECNDYLSHHLK